MNKKKSSPVYTFFMVKSKEKSGFAKNLVAIRKARGISQRDLAKMTDISNRVIAYYETGNSIPSMKILEKLSQVLKVPIAALIDPHSSNKEVLNLNTRTIKKIKMLEQLSPENQRKVLDYIKALMAEEKMTKHQIAS